MIVAPACMCSSAARQVWNIARMFMRNVRSSSELEMSAGPSRAIWKAAVLTRQRTPPHSGPGDAREPLARHLEGGVVDEDVDAAQLLSGAVNQRPAVALVLEVPGELERRPAGVAHHARGLVGVGLLILEVGDRDVGALAGERERDGPADPRVAAGHDRLAALEPAAAAVGRLTEVGRVAHVALEPRVLELVCGQRVGMLGRRILNGVLVVGHAVALPGGPGRFPDPAAWAASSPTCA